MTEASPDGGKESGHEFLGRILIVAVLVAGVLLSGAMAGFLWQRFEREARQERERRATLLAERVRATVLEHINALHGIRVLWEYSEDLNAAEFEGAARDYINRFPGVAALEWVPRVSREERPAYEAGMRAAGFVDFGITEEVAFESSKLQPAGDRAEYFPVTYIEPLAPNLPALGFDISSGASWRLREASARSGEPGGSRVTRLLRDDPTETSMGWMLHVPVYQRNLDAAVSPEERRRALRGFVLGVFRLEELFAVVAAEQDAAHLDLLVLEEAELGAPRLVHHRTSENTPSAAPTAPEWGGYLDVTRSAVRRIEVAGRVWSLWMRPDAHWPTTRGWLQPVITFLLGLTVTMLTAGLLIVLRRRHVAVRREVALRTAELRTNREELAGILENSPNAIFVKDLEGRHLAANRRYCEVLGKRREQIVGRTDAELFGAEESARFQATDAKVVATGRGVSFEEGMVINGREHHSIVHKFPLFTDRGAVRAVCVIATDITQRKQLEAEQRTVERKMLEAQKLESLGVLAGGIAHDFNNLLTGVLGNASLAAAEAGPDSPVQPLLSDIQHAANRAAELCRQMLDYSGRGAFSAGPVDMNLLVTETLPLLRHSVSKHTTLEVDLAPDLPVTRADVTQIRQVLMNLVINASEALEERPGTVRIVTGRARAEGFPAGRAIVAPAEPAATDAAFAQLTVEDNGSGMDETTQARIFDPFFTTKFTGRGLGLAAVSGIVRGHEGRLILDSVVGRGTRFHLLLPLREASDGVEPAIAGGAPPAGRPWRGTGRVLIIDDEEPVRRVAARAVQRFGFEVEEAGNGQAGLDCFDAGRGDYALVLLDLTMPGLSGDEVWARLRARRPGVRVVIMSGYSPEQIADRWPGDPPAGVLQKPFSIEALRQVMQAATG